MDSEFKKLCAALDSVDIKQKIIQRIEERLKEWGHHHAPGCVVCVTARLLIDEAIRHDGEGYRVVEGVTVWGPPS
jgi:predicted ATP-grasp superfamily ATP-dependent carboligase